MILFLLSSVKCYGLKLYFKDSTARCPATCKLTDSRSKGICTSQNSPDKLLRVVTTDNGGPVVSVKSTDYNCKSANYTYPRRLMCIYNINMAACNSGLIKVNVDSKIDMEAEDRSGDCNDFVQVLEYNGQRQHKKVCGSRWPQELRTIHATKFALLFWSGQNTDRGRGFNLQLECDNPTTLATHPPTTPSDTPTPEQESSGDVTLSLN